MDLTDEASFHNTHRFAIIGAGAGGSSAAFWISKSKERFGHDIEVDVYEKENYIGGRSHIVHPYENSSLPSIEYGASIFVSANKNLWRASDEFNLTRRDFRDVNARTGLWDGEQVLFSFGNGWWDSIKLAWRYGLLSPKRADNLVANMIKSYLTLYSPETPHWRNVADLAETFGWWTLLQSTTSEYFVNQGISELFVDEMVEAATRVNYGQNADEMHALEGTVSLAASGATSIQGGNFQLFEGFLNRSGANVHLRTPVTSIRKNSGKSRPWTVESSEGTVNYDAIILAAPYHSSKIAIPSSLSSQIPPQPYVHLHVTLLTTTSPTPSPKYFSQPADFNMPTTILTTDERFRNGGKAPEFNSLSYLGLVREDEWAVKIFSEEYLSDEWLDQMFLGKVGWTFRKEWEAYPKLPPTSSFPPIKLDEGFYYVNAFEPFISVMETETVSSRNIVDMLLKEQFNSSICHTPTAVTDDKEFIYGWDC